MFYHISDGTMDDPGIDYDDINGDGYYRAYD